jgi:hypothetical protein
VKRISLSNLEAFLTAEREAEIRKLEEEREQAIGVGKSVALGPITLRVICDMSARPRDIWHIVIEHTAAWEAKMRDTDELVCPAMMTSLRHFDSRAEAEAFLDDFVAGIA